jgi:hypothetical protein
MMEAVRTSETSVYSYETIQCYIPEGSTLHTHSHENLKSNIKMEAGETLWEDRRWMGMDQDQVEWQDMISGSFIKKLETETFI